MSVIRTISCFVSSRFFLRYPSQSSIAKPGILPVINTHYERADQRTPTSTIRLPDQSFSWAIMISGSVDRFGTATMKYNNPAGGPERSVAGIGADRAASLYS